MDPIRRLLSAGAQFVPWMPALPIWSSPRLVPDECCSRPAEDTSTQVSPNDGQAVQSQADLLSTVDPVLSFNSPFDFPEFPQGGIPLSQEDGDVCNYSSPQESGWDPSSSNFNFDSLPDLTGTSRQVLVQQIEYALGVNVIYGLEMVEQLASLYRDPPSECPPSYAAAQRMSASQYIPLMSESRLQSLGREFSQRPSSVDAVVHRIWANPFATIQLSSGASTHY
ncbi:hypothetical protein NMY22_g6875 [Coprinellus aureogranulatus]|nr:hypothetical protein NMY22_g6875 [Coprinellus aureogranulatus]